MHFGANSHVFAKNGIRFSSSYALTCTKWVCQWWCPAPQFATKKLARELKICDRVSCWWAKTALIMLKFTPITLQRKRREGGHQRKIWNVDETLSKASVLQRRGHQRKKGNAGVFKPTSAITNSQSKVLGKSSYDIWNTTSEWTICACSVFPLAKWKQIFLPPDLG